MILNLSSPPPTNLYVGSSLLVEIYDPLYTKYKKSCILLRTITYKFMFVNRNGFDPLYAYQQIQYAIKTNDSHLA